MSKTVFSGLESSGKSLRLAKVSIDLVYRNSKWNKLRLEQYQEALASWERSMELRRVTDEHLEWERENPCPVPPEPRPIASNIIFKEHFHVWATQEMGVPIVYWKDLDELIKYDNVDVIIDEIGTYFDSRLWSDLSLDVRRWLSQGAKSGIEMYGSAQDFAQVDLAFRRLTTHLYHIVKVIGSPRPSATKPPVTKVWGVCMIRELNPREYKEDKKSFDKTQMIPSFFLIEKAHCEIFDTTQKIMRSAPPRLKHVHRTCENDSCGYVKIQHI